MTELSDYKRIISAFNAALRGQIEAIALFLDAEADILDRWATESRAGGWSTHQVRANTEQANLCRRRAAEIRTALKEQPPHA